MDNIVTLPYATSEDVDAAARFIASLIPTGVSWRAEILGHKMHVHFTGGY